MKTWLVIISKQKTFLVRLKELMESIPLEKFRLPAHVYRSRCTQTTKSRFVDTVFLATLAAVALFLFWQEQGHICISSSRYGKLVIT